MNSIYPYSSDDEYDYSGGRTTTKKRGNAKHAATLRISESMTVAQLQEECKLRSIRGYSGLTKDSLLDLLGVGTVWMALSVSKTERESKKQKVKPTKGSTATKKKPVKSKHTSNQRSSVMWFNGPKVSNSMTMSQMTYELMTRGYTGSVSSKKKADLLLLLGEGSIWTTAPSTR